MNDILLRFFDTSVQNLIPAITTINQSNPRRCRLLEQETKQNEE